MGFNTHRLHDTLAQSYTQYIASTRLLVNSAAHHLAHNRRSYSTHHMLPCTLLLLQQQQSWQYHLWHSALWDGLVLPWQPAAVEPLSSIIISKNHLSRLGLTVLTCPHQQPGCPVEHTLLQLARSVCPSHCGWQAQGRHCITPRSLQTPLQNLKVYCCTVVWGNVMLGKQQAQKDLW